MKRFAVALAILASTACDYRTGPVYYVGPATASIIAWTDTTWLMHDDSGVLIRALPGDSACLRFHADGNVQLLTVWNHTVSQHLAWLPDPKVPHVNYYLSDWLIGRVFARVLGC